jgi:hypothetical protein
MEILAYVAFGLIIVTAVGWIAFDLYARTR